MRTSIKGIHYDTQEKIEVKIESDRIVAIDPLPGDSPYSALISPGLVDLQINGFDGIDFNEGTLSEAAVVSITERLFQEGVTQYMPTLITNSDEHISSTLQTIVRACERHKLVNDSLLGIHLEGPFLSKEDGPRGAHPLAYIKPPDWELFDYWQQLAKGKIKMITLAPEWPEAPEFIKKCTEAGVVMAIGHTAAGAKDIEKAVEAGAKLSTHLGNATHLSLPRHHNYIWEQLAADNLAASLIADGFHLPESVLKVFLKVKKHQTILVSDATKFAGMSPGIYTSHIGGEIELGESGKLFMKGEPQMLAGSAQSLKWCVNHLIKSKIESPKNAIKMASLKPLELFKKADLYTLKEKSMADLIVWDNTEKGLKIRKTIKGGKTVFTG